MVPNPDVGRGAGAGVGTLVGLGGPGVGAVGRLELG